MCAFQLSFVSNVTPKKRISVTSLIDVLPMNSFRPVLYSMAVSLGSGLHILVLEVFICMSL